jgi:peptidoglycan/xylan/chitin deacetylase (PgdA/CDA1 family)
MICLTGDVHHRSYRHIDLRYVDQTEVQLALRYCDIASRHHVKVTLFVTGKACLEEREILADLGRRTNCEIGGHTFCAFRSWRHWLSKSLGGSALGSASVQRKDIERTIEAIRDATGKRITTWRNHAYKHDAHTYPLLGQAGIRIVSDRVAANTTAAERVSQDLLSLPINTLPDHEHLLHGTYVPEHAPITELEGRMPIDEWRADVERRVETIERLGGIATILAHPLCMEVADGMRSFERLCRFVSRYQTYWVSEAADSRL